MKILVINNTPSEVEAISLCLGIIWSDSVVLSAERGSKGLELVRAEKPDLVLLDTELPDMHGFEVCHRIRQFSEVPLIVLSEKHREVDIAKGLNLGADDYISKPFGYMELQARANALLRRAQKLTETTKVEPPFVSGDLMVDFASQEVCVKSKLVNLTLTEYQILCCLVRNAGRVVTYDTLLEYAWGPLYEGESGLLRVHIQRLRQKLGDDAQSPSMILTMRGVGYKFIKPS